MVVACIALFASISGVGYAALKLKPNSVKTKNIKDAAVVGPKIADTSVSTEKLADNSVTTPKIASDAVTGAKVKDGSLTTADVTGATNLVATGKIASPGTLAMGTCSAELTAPAPGAKDGDTLVITPPANVTTLATSFTGRVTDGAVHYVACNLSGANQNYGTVATIGFAVFR